MPLLTYIPEILEEHFEELAFLLHFRAVQLSSGRMLFRQFIELDDRLQGHIQGLLAFPDGTSALAEPQLAGKDPLNIRAAAFILLQISKPGVVEKCLALLKNPAIAPAILDAFLLRRVPEAQAGLKVLAQSEDSPLLAAMATTIQAEHFPRDLNAAHFGKLLMHADAPVKAAAWRAAQRHPEPRMPAQYRAGCGDPVPSVRDAALLAAAWANQPIVLDVCRPFLKKMKPENLLPLRLYALLAPPGEAAALAELAKANELGPARFDLLAASSLPAMVPHLLAAMRQADPAIAAAAADAFERMTNYQPQTKGTAKTPQPGAASAFDKEFVPEVNVPDPDAAQKYWSSVEGSLGKATRIARGYLADPVPADLSDFDCLARETVLLRNVASPEGKKYAAWSARWAFPQRAAH